MKRIIKVFCGLILVAIIAICVFGIAPLALENADGDFDFSFENPFSSLLDDGKNTAANAALNASGAKEKVARALESNNGKIAEATDLSQSQVDEAIDKLDIESWEVTSLPEEATETGSTSVTYEGNDATVTTYDDPSVVTVDALGQSVTLAVPESAQDYMQYLDYLE